MRSIAENSARERWFEGAWSRWKSWHRIRVGPISVLVRLARSGPLQDRRARRFEVEHVVHSSRPSNNAPSAPATHTGFTSSAAQLNSVLIAGVGRCFGTLAASFFAGQSACVALAARDAARLHAIAQHIRSQGGRATAYACDLTHERDVERLVSNVTQAQGAPDLCIYAVERFCSGDALGSSVAAFEESWRANCLGGFLVARETGRLMVQRGHGTIVFMGGTSSILGRSGYLNLAVGKHGLRAVSQVMARELNHRGVHVAHCLIDGDVSSASDGDDDHVMDPVHLAQEILRLHLQPPDCWTLEMDLRPAGKRFWEHC